MEAGGSTGIRQPPDPRAPRLVRVRRSPRRPALDRHRRQRQLVPPERAANRPGRRRPHLPQPLRLDREDGEVPPAGCSQVAACQVIAEIRSDPND